MYWKNVVESFAKEENPAFWLQKEFYYLKNEDKNILKTKDAWLNDRIMDAAQKLICKTSGKIDSFQSVLNSQKRSDYLFRVVNNEHIQLLHDGNNEKPRWSVYTEEFKCTLSKFQRYVEWKTDIVISACSK